MNKILSFLLVMIFAGQVGCGELPIKTQDLNMGVMNCIYWNDLVLANNVKFDKYLSENGSFDAQVYLYEYPGVNPSLFVKFLISTKDDAVIAFTKNGNHQEYNNYAYGQGLGGMKLLGTEKVLTKNLNIKFLKDTFKYLSADEGEKFIKNCFGDPKGETFYIGPLSDSNAFVNVYEKDKDLIWWLPVSPAVLDEVGAHDIKIACPATLWGHPHKGSEPELKRTKDILVGTGVKVQCK
jgi:hypothetical protein